MPTIETGLRDTFLEASFNALLARVRDNAEPVDETELPKFEELAQSGCYPAQMALATMYAGTEIFDEDDPCLATHLHDDGKACHWAMQASASPKCRGYDALNMARILLQNDNPLTISSKLRALSLILKAQGDDDTTLQFAAIELVQEHFQDFDVEAHLAELAATHAAPQTLTTEAPTPVGPQPSLF